MNESNELNESIKQTVIQYHNNITRIAFTYVKNLSDAEDIAQEVFLTFVKHMPSFENDEHKKAWLIRVAINKAKDYTKMMWFRNRVTLTDDFSYLPEEESMILHDVMLLDNKYRVPIHLFYYEGYSIEEIAKLLNTKTATIGTRLARGRKQLKHQLGGFEHE